MDCPEHFVENGEIIIPGYEDYDYLTLEQIENFTDEEKEIEYAKCAVNPLYFIENYIWIFHIDKGKVPFRLYEYQKKFVKSMWCKKSVCTLWNRQAGKSTTAGAFILWEAIFTSKINKRHILIAAHKFDGARDIIRRITEMYWSLPDWMRSDEDEVIATEIRFSNNSLIQVTTTTADSGRGKSLWRVYADEFAFVKKSIADDFYSGILPALGSHGRICITSTPNSDSDMFADIVRKASDVFDEHGNPNSSGLGSNNFFLCKATWVDHPERDKQWYDDMTSKMSQEKFAREHECVDGDTTLVTIRKNGVIQQVTVSELYRMQLDHLI